MADSIKVLIIDDHPFIRLGIRSTVTVQSDIDVIAEAGDGQTALQFAREFLPDVILIDLELPDMPGTQVIQTITNEDLPIRCLVCSNYSDNQHIMTALQSGAIGYILKTDSPEKIITAIRNAARGIATLSQSAESSLIFHLHKKQSTPASPTELTGRELEILRMMAAGMSNTEIASRCYISEGTVRTHISHILTKLNLDNRAQLVIYAIKQGLISL